MATLKQIAQEAGVSVMTVSNVINHNYDKVSAKTAERVEAIARKYNYVPNLSARSLSGKRSRIITVLVPEGDKPIHILDDPYRQQMIAAMEFQLRVRGYYVMLRAYKRAKEVIYLFHNWSVDGAIFFYPTFSQEEMKQVLDTGVPCVILDRYYEGRLARGPGTSPLFTGERPQADRICLSFYGAVYCGETAYPGLCPGAAGRWSAFPSAVFLQHKRFV